MKINEHISHDKVISKIKEIAKQLSIDFPEEINCIIVMDGAKVFFDELKKHLKTETIVADFITLKSYKGKKSTGEVSIEDDLLNGFKNKPTIIIEDIVDTGNTITFLKNHLKKFGIKEIKICSLLSKPDKNNLKIDYLGFNIPDKFVVGFGLDHDGKYRDLDFIGFLE